jgi:hypothetical protein
MLQIGRVTERWLEVLDVKTCGDIWDQRAKLMLMRSEISFDLLLKVSKSFLFYALIIRRFSQRKKKKKRFLHFYEVGDDVDRLTWD